MSLGKKLELILQRHNKASIARPFINLKAVIFRSSFWSCILSYVYFLYIQSYVLLHKPVGVIYILMSNPDR